MTKNYVWWVDIPTSRKDGADNIWENTGTFFSHKEAIAFAKEEYCADENGCVCLITLGETVEDNDEKN